MRPGQGMLYIHRHEAVLGLQYLLDSLCHTINQDLRLQGTAAQHEQQEQLVRCSAMAACHEDITVLAARGTHCLPLLQAAA